MNIHEYQAKEILSKFGASTPNGVVIFSLNEIDKAFDLRLNACGYRNIASQPAKAHRPLPACVLEVMSDSWKTQHGY